MASKSSTIPLIILLLTLFLPSSSSSSSSLTCTTQNLKQNNNKVYPNCIDLPALNSYLHYTHNPTNSSLSIAFIATPATPSGWISWGINPTGAGMIGAQVIVGYKIDGVMTVKTLDLKSYNNILPGSLDVWDVEGEEDGGVMRIFATVKLPSNGIDGVNHVWQVGPSVSKGRIDVHGVGPPNLNSKGRLSFNAAMDSAHSDSPLDSRTKNKNTHGILNAVSWGVLFLLGVIIARYIKVFPSADPAWFYLHVGCQLSAYAIGVSGWATGLKLGSESVGITFHTHRNIGIALFTLATIQIFALFLRPKKDHKYRYFWNIYHHSFGYTIITLGIINIFRGFDILHPEDKWKTAYVAVIIALAAIALVLEVITWIIVLKRKSKNSTKTYDGYNN